MAAIPADIADRLLDLLASDDAFRASFQKDPRAALEHLGYTTPATDNGVGGQDPMMCMDGARALPSKQQFRDARRRLRDQLTSVTHSYVIFALG